MHFAPGTQHGALDVDAIREMIPGKPTANEAFQARTGVNFSMPESERMRTVAMFSAMECAALFLLNPRAKVALPARLTSDIAPEVEMLLGCDVAIYDEWCASLGLARIARDVLPVHRHHRDQRRFVRILREQETLSNRQHAIQTGALIYQYTMNAAAPEGTPPRRIKD